MAWNESNGGNNPRDPWGGGNQGPPDLDEVLKKLQRQLGGFLAANLLEAEIKLAIRYLFSDFLLLFLFGHYPGSIKLMSRSEQSSCDLESILILSNQVYSGIRRYSTRLFWLIPQKFVLQASAK